MAAFSMGSPKLHSKDCYVKAIVRDPPELMRQQGKTACALVGQTPVGRYMDFVVGR